MKPYHFWLDQYGYGLWAASRKELISKEGSNRRVSKMYRDKADGSVVHVGYIIGDRWFTRLAPVEVPT